MPPDLAAQLAALDPWIRLVQSAPADLGHSIDGGAVSPTLEKVIREANTSL